MNLRSSFWPHFEGLHCRYLDNLTLAGHISLKYLVLVYC